jgi:5-deoxy-glucuronate isomerase
MEEIYFFKVKPEKGFGMQRLYDSKGMDNAYTIKNNDAIMIAGGYHPVVAAPGYTLYYLWFLAGRGRKLIPRDDPNHAWVKRS